MASEESLAYYDDTIRDFGLAPTTRAIMRVLTERNHYAQETPDAFEWCRWDAANIARLLEEGVDDEPSAVRAALLNTGVHGDEDDAERCLRGDVPAVLDAYHQIASR